MKKPFGECRGVFRLTAWKNFAKVRSEAIKMTEQISITIDSKDLEEFKETTGMTLRDCMKLLMDNVKYGGKLGFDPFWSEENQKCLQKSIRELEEGKNVVKFTAEEWEKFVNAQELQ